jgi:hypothetical protein
LAEVLPFRKPTLKDKHKGNTLCRHGHHKWRIDASTRFDVKQGKLLTLIKCERCGAERTEAR